MVNATTEAGLKIGSGATSWVTVSGSYTVEHLAAASPTGDLLVFWWSPRAGRWQVVNATAEAGQKVVGPLTSWVTRDGEYTVEHVAGRAPDGDLLVFYWSPRHGRWRVVNATAEAGSKIAGGPASWVTTSGPYTVEHLAAVSARGDLMVFWWSPRAGRWQVVNATRLAGGSGVAGAPTSYVHASRETLAIRGGNGGLLVHWWSASLDWQAFDVAEATGTRIAGDAVSWLRGPSRRTARLAARTLDGHVLVFSVAGAEQQLTDDLRSPAFSLKRMRRVRRKVLTILWDPHKPNITRPAKAVAEAAVLGAVNSVRGYYLENSDGLFTIESAEVLGWYDSKYPPSGTGLAGARRAATAVRKRFAGPPPSSTLRHMT